MVVPIPQKEGLGLEGPYSLTYPLGNVSKLRSVHFLWHPGDRHGGDLNPKQLRLAVVTPTG